MEVNRLITGTSARPDGARSTSDGCRRYGGRRAVDGRSASCLHPRYKPWSKNRPAGSSARELHPGATVPSTGGPHMSELQQTYEGITSDLSISCAPYPAAKAAGELLQELA